MQARHSHLDMVKPVHTTCAYARILLVQNVEPTRAYMRTVVHTHVWLLQLCVFFFNASFVPVCAVEGVA